MPKQQVLVFPKSMVGLRSGLFGAIFVLLGLLPLFTMAAMPEPPGQVKPGEAPKNEAYLFAHIMQGDYGRLYYSVSLDGLHWKPLNARKRVFEEYHGHPDICRGPDGRYYLVGNRGDDKPDINFWVSNDLITWTKFSVYTPDLKSIPDYPGVLMRIGAPKLYFDEPSKQFVVTWHTTHDMGKTDLPEPYWAGQRTIYATSKDLKTFDAPPKRLFPGEEMATIDTSIRRDGDKYYAVFKDERYPSLDWTTGKTIRIRSSDHLLGPYADAGPSISPSFREAPTVIPSPDGKAWYCYYEQYPGMSYGVSAAAHLSGPWYQLSGNTSVADWNKFEMTPGARHGSMLVISRKEYDALVAHFGL
jgi:hypothetical protein